MMKVLFYFISLIPKSFIVVLIDTYIYLKIYKFFNSYKVTKVNLKIAYPDLNIEIKTNSSIGILGKSGSGKTTLLDILSGLVAPKKGNIFVDDKLIENNYLRRKFQNNISYISQKTTVINDTLLKNICFGVEEKNIDFQRYNLALEICELKDIEKNFDDKFKRVTDFGKNISGGQLQRVGIARAIYENKEVLIFDEATNALDENLEKKIVSKLIEIKKGKILIFVSHNQNLLNNFDSVYEIKNGNIIKLK